jgi:hypothetical protein
MAGDYTRFSFDPADDYAGVRMQQGKVMVDADWNELVDALDRRARAESIDTVGRCAVPRETPNGFRITIDAGTLTIGPGRAYVDGLLAENRGAGELGHDPSLEELRGGESLPYDRQPYLPEPPDPALGDALVYLDVFRREVTAVEDPGLRDPAIGFDTTTRTQTIWQVRTHPVDGGGVDCDTELETVPGWLERNAPSAGRLTSAAIGTPVADDPCALPATGGYRGLENRLYRVEIHEGGELGEASFKWSRDNASLTVAVTDIDALTTLTVDSVGGDATMRFGVGDWAEVLDDRLELAGAPGVLRKVAAVDPVSGTVELSDPLPADVFDVTDPPSLRTRLRRWDQAGEVLAPDGTRVADVDASGGAITVPGAGEVILEDGVVISFSSATAGGRFRTGDHWCFAARTADGSVEELAQAPPRGVHHHYCALAVIEAGAVHDCRRLWPPEAAEECGCSVCVTAESHASGALTIQRAIDEVTQTGGTVCLGAGDYHLTDPLVIRLVRSLRIFGQGAAATRILASGHAAAMIETSTDIEIRDVGIVMLGPLGIGLRNVTGALLSRCSIEARTKFTRASLGLVARDTTPLGGIAVGLVGVISNASIRECLLNAGVAGTAIGKLGAVRRGLELDRPAILTALDRYATIGLAHNLTGIREFRPAEAPTPSATELRGALTVYRPSVGFGITAANIERLGPLLAVDLIVEDCYLFGRHGIALGGFNMLGGQTRLSGNVVRSLASGVTLSGSTLAEKLTAALGARGSSMVAPGAAAGGPARAIVDRNLVSFGFGEGIVVGAETAQISDNHLAGAGGERPLAGTAVVAIGAGPGREAESLRVNGNRIVGAPRAAISVACKVRDLDVSGNLISRPGRSGITMEDDASADAALVAANQLRDVAPELTERGSHPSGIRLVAAQRAVITGNTVSGVATATTDDATRRGIQVIGAGAVRIADNTVVGIGPISSYAGTAVGIEVLSGASRVDVSGNEVSRTGSSIIGAGGSEWRALRLGDPFLERLVFADAVAVADRVNVGLPAYGFFALSNPLSLFLTEGIRYLVGDRLVFTLPELPEEITVRGNHLQASGRIAAALVVTDGSCVFSENHVHRAGEKAEPAVELRAGTLVVQGNRASAPRSGPAIALFAQADALTALGNVASHGIELNGDPLPDPWSPLNASA